MVFCKYTSKGFPFRPIIIMVGVPAYTLAKCLVGILGQCSGNCLYHGKNYEDFICTTNTLWVTLEDIVVTFDMSPSLPKWQLEMHLEPFHVKSDNAVNHVILWLFILQIDVHEVEVFQKFKSSTVIKSIDLRGTHPLMLTYTSLLFSVSTQQLSKSHFTFTVYNEFISLKSMKICASFHQLLHNHPHLSSGACTIGQKWPQYLVDIVPPH
jgi:hypothetical protein